MKRLSTGKVVTCLECGKNVYTINKDLGMYDVMSSEHFDPFPGVEPPRKGEKMDCPFCKKKLERSIVEAYLQCKLII